MYLLRVFTNVAWCYFLFQMFVSRLTAYFRRKCVSTTDERVQKMNEVLNYIKFIKMYAWVKPFSQNVQSEFTICRCFLLS